MPFTHTSRMMPLWVPLPITSLKMLAYHWPGPSSVAAVSHMHNHTTRNSGRPISLNAPPSVTPAALPSVGGNRWPANMNA